jgi:hypothetical protein
MSEVRGDFLDRRLLKVVQENEDLKRRLNSPEGGGTSGSVEPSERLATVESSVAWIKVILGVMTAVMLGGFALLSTQIINLGSRIDGTAARLDSRVDNLSAKIDAIPRQLSEEFRAMRAEMSAQTSAIANSITATKQVQPQIIVMPPPEPAPKP